MLLKKLVTNCPRHLRNIKISDLTSDSREVKKNSLFFAIKGKNYDGFNFVNEAIKKGAAAIISSKKLKYKNSLIISEKKLKNYYQTFVKNFIIKTFKLNCSHRNKWQKLYCRIL